jgi:hypothetical protein
MGKKSAGIKRQVVHIADWWLAFGLWQFFAGVGKGPAIALLIVGVAVVLLSIKDVIFVKA